MASHNLAMCHPTSPASKNVKSLPPRNPMKFDVVTKFFETISTEKSVSSFEIYKNFDFTEIAILPFLRKLDFIRVSQHVYLYKL